MIKYYSTFYRSQKFWLALCTAICLCIQAASLQANDDPEIKKAEDSMNNLMAQIQQTIGDARCETQKQCRALAVGSRACGGPSAYLAYSTLNTDAKKLKNLAKRYGLANRKFNRLTNAISNCQMVLQPPIICLNSTCEVAKD